MKAGDKFHTLTVTGLEFSCKFTNLQQNLLPSCYVNYFYSDDPLYPPFLCPWTVCDIPSVELMRTRVKVSSRSFLGFRGLSLFCPCDNIKKKSSEVLEKRSKWGKEAHKNGYGWQFALQITLCTGSFFWPHIKISTWLLLPCPCFTFGLLSLSGTDGQAAGLH